MGNIEDHVKRSMLVNFTNHPSHFWDEKQMRMGLQYGEIFDLPFPVVDEIRGEIYISELVEESLQTILQLRDKYNITVHIMGELCFTFSMVKRLQKLGIKCIASTTKRIVREESEGCKRDVVFKFERFREYR